MASFTSPSLADVFFSPLLGMATGSPHARRCPELTDDNWLRLGITRVVSDACTGRGFLQQVAALLTFCPQLGHFFETLKSGRRLALVNEVSTRLAAKLSPCFPDPPVLRDYAIYAGDGHWHAAAAHDPDIDERRRAVGHLYALNLRTRSLRHLSLAQGKKEHDMGAIKRLGAKALRMDEPVGRKVLWVWDRAGVDFALWHHWKHNSGIYFLSRTKENMKLEVLAPNSFDRADAINRGVESDDMVSTSQHVMVRRVRYREPLSGEAYEFITTAYDLPPGVIAWLYKRRWDIEKVFDQLKNKLNEAKAWASSATAKEMQAHFLCMAHNLLELLERRLAVDHGVRNEAGLRRAKHRLDNYIEKLTKQNRSPSSLLTASARPLQRSIKLLRWLRTHWLSPVPLHQILTHLQRLYSTS